MQLNPWRCKGRMRELGWTCRTLAEELEKRSGKPVSHGYLSHIINLRRPGRHLWPVLAQVLQCSIADLTNPNVRDFSHRCCADAQRG